MTAPDPGNRARPSGLSVIIVSYNVRELLDACLQSLRHAAARLLQEGRGPVEIIVFDNDSRDGTVSLLRPRWPEVVWIPSDRNLGFGTGCNRGAAVATQDLLLFLNPDTLVREDTLAVMMDFFDARDNVGAAGCKIVNRDGSLQAASKRSFPSPRVAAYKFLGLGNLFPRSRVFGRYNLTYLDENETHEVDAVSGSFLCVRAAVFRAVGGFDEDFFMYGEDLDLCFRIKALGLRNHYHPATQVIHFKGESAKTRPLRSFLYFYEAMILFSRKHLELRTLPGLLLTVGVVTLGAVNFASSRFRKWPRWLADLALVNGALAGIAYAYYEARGISHIAAGLPGLYALWHLLASLAVLLPLAWIGDYGRRVAPLRTVLVAAATGFLAFLAFGFFFHEHAFSRIVFGITGLISPLLVVGWRWLGERAGRLFRRIMGGAKRVALLGTGPRAQSLAGLIQGEALEGYECVGFIHFPPGPVPAAVRPGVIGDLDGLGALARKLDLQGVIIALEEDAYPAALQVLARRGSRALEIKMLLGDPTPGNIALVDLNFGG
jgi:GT2 family glycosyltransferase